MGEEHSAAAVSLQAKGIQGISINEQQLKNITDEVSQNHLYAFPKQHTDYFELSHIGKFVCSSKTDRNAACAVNAPFHLVLLTVFAHSPASQSTGSAAEKGPQLPQLSGGTVLTCFCKLRRILAYFTR